MYPILIPKWPLPVNYCEDLGIAADITALREAGYPLVIGGLSPHDRSRSYLVSRALEEYPSAEAFIMLDDDTEVGLEEVNALVTSYDHVVKNHEGMVASVNGVYFCRHQAARGIMAPSVSFDLRDFPQARLDIPFFQHGGVFKVFGAGAGFGIVNAEVFHLMDAPAAIYDDLEGGSYEGKAWYLPLVHAKQHLGEDRSFCHRILHQQLGQQFVDTRLLVPHAGWRLMTSGELASASS